MNAARQYDRCVGFAGVIAMARSYEHSFVHKITVATPCHESWEGMTGDDLSRFCGSCKLNVYNISAMSTDEAEQLIIAKEGKLCVRFFRRADGTILTKDCPKGLKMVRDRMLRGAAIFAGLISACAAYLMTVVNHQPAQTECAVAKIKGLVAQGQVYVSPQMESSGGGASIDPEQYTRGAVAPGYTAGLPVMGDYDGPARSVKGHMAIRTK